MKGGGAGIWLMNADGTHARPLTTYVVEIATGKSAEVTAGVQPQWFDDDTLIVD